MPENEIALVLTGTLPQISGNFDACKAWYLAELARYDAEVDPEKLTDAKKDLATLRAEAKRLDTIRIAEAKRLKQPIADMEAKVKELTDLIGKTVAKIDQQVKLCEQKSLDLCTALMTEHLGATYAALGVREEYQTGHAMIAPMVGLSKLTGSKALTKAARESIEGLAQQAKIAQDRVEVRLSRLKSECLQAGIQPIDPEAVTHLLPLDDPQFNAGMLRMIAAEVKRTDDAKAAIIEAEQDRLKREAEATARAEMEKRLAAEKLEREEVDRKAAEIAKSEREKRLAEQKAVPPPAQVPFYLSRTAPETKVSVPAEEKAREPAQTSVYLIRISATGPQDVVVNEIFAALSAWEVESVEVDHA